MKTKLTQSKKISLLTSIIIILGIIIIASPVLAADLKQGQPTPITTPISPSPTPSSDEIQQQYEILKRDAEYQQRDFEFQIQNIYWQVTIILLIFTISSFYIYMQAKAQAKKLEQRIFENIHKAEKGVESQPEKARPAWDLSRVYLDAYFNRNINQITYIFWFSVFVMFVGFGVIIWGVSQAIQFPTLIMPAGITVGAGIITDFVGTTFILIYRSTLNQALSYTKALERMNTVGMAMQILDTMPDEAKSDNLKDKTKAILVELLVKQPYSASESVNIEVKGDS